MKVDTAITITLTNEELHAVKVVHNMLARLPVRDVADLESTFPSSAANIDSIQESLALIYELANDGDMSELVFIRGE